MAIYQIPISKDLKNGTFIIELNKIEYTFYIKYNTRGDYYTYDLYTKDNEPLVQGQKIVSNYCLNHRFKDLRLPKGRIFSVNIADDNKEPNQDNLGLTVLITYEQV